MIIFIANDVCNLNKRRTYFGGFKLSLKNRWCGNCAAVDHGNAKKYKYWLVFEFDCFACNAEYIVASYGIGEVYNFHGGIVVKCIFVTHGGSARYL